MAFVLYRSPTAPPGHLGESLRTRDVAVAWSQIRRFLTECTDDPPPRGAMLRVDAPVDDDGGVAASIAEDATDLFGASTPWRSHQGDERGWEWNAAADSLQKLVDFCEEHEMRPRIHVNAAVRQHGSPPTPQVWAAIDYAITLRCGVIDTHLYRPGWGQSQLRAYLGYNEIWLVLHFPFDHIGVELERAVAVIEAQLGHALSRERLKVHAT